MKLLSILGLVAFTTLANAQQIVTLTVSGIGDSNSVAIASDQVATVKTYYDSATVQNYTSTASYMLITRGAFQLAHGRNARLFGGSTGVEYSPEIIIEGPAEISLISQTADPNANSMLTLEISPGQYPPGRSAVIGERDGPMKCTLEESTDLVNWTQSTSGQTHTLTNANAKKFFRIKLEQDVGP